MVPISCFPKGFCAQQPCYGQGPQGGLFWWPGLHSEHTSSRSRCKSLLSCTMPEEAGWEGGEPGSDCWSSKHLLVFSVVPFLSECKENPSSRLITFVCVLLRTALWS